MSRTADAIRDEMLGQLMPKGWAWPQDRTSNLASLIQTIAECRALLEHDIESLRLEIAPGTSVRLLADYEAILGPTCADSTAQPLTFAQRQSVAQARWVGRKIVSRQDFIDYAAQFGFEIEIEEYRASRVGTFRVGDPVRSGAWDYAWIVRSPGYTPVYFRVGQSAMGEPLVSWGNTILRCLLSSRNPAHLTLGFGQTNKNIISDFGPDIL